MVTHQSSSVQYYPHIFFGNKKIIYLVTHRPSLKKNIVCHVGCYCLSLLKTRVQLFKANDVVS